MRKYHPPPDYTEYQGRVQNNDRAWIGTEMLSLIYQYENSGGYTKKRAKSKLHKLQQMSLALLVKQPYRTRKGVF